jgi:hypothetical protein
VNPFVRILFLNLRTPLTSILSSQPAAYVLFLYFHTVIPSSPSPSWFPAADVNPAMQGHRPQTRMPSHMCVAIKMSRGRCCRRRKRRSDDVVYECDKGPCRCTTKIREWMPYYFLARPPPMLSLAHTHMNKDVIVSHPRHVQALERCRWRLLCFVQPHHQEWATPLWDRSCWPFSGVWRGPMSPNMFVALERRAPHYGKSTGGRVKPPIEWMITYVRCVTGRSVS